MSSPQNKFVMRNVLHSGYWRYKQKHFNSSDNRPTQSSDRYNTSVTSKAEKYLKSELPTIKLIENNIKKSLISNKSPILWPWPLNQSVSLNAKALPKNMSLIISVISLTTSKS